MQCLGIKNYSPDMNIPQDIRKRVKQRVVELIKIAEQQYDYCMERPTILYTLNTSSSGIVYFKDWIININPTLLINNVDEYINQTIPHEVAHLVVHLIFPEAHTRRLTWCDKKMKWKRTNYRGHGKEWKRVMRVFGCEPNTYHTYNH